ncbi:MAG: hypothetical protein J6T16_00655 [Opitutales bacterium]|nr:hypothetical protein [Opitutales bacterium]
MNEQDFIKMFAKIHRLRPYEADAERFGGMLLSVDSFSKKEDFFENTPAKRIGKNMAAAACADLLACGASPQFLLQAWGIDEAEDAKFYGEIAEGVEEVLAHYKAKCIGGDIGSSSPWTWTATVGARSDFEPVGRIARSREPFKLYATGAFGGANLAYFLGEPMPEFEPRRPVPQNALFATDTSGGFFDAIENFRRVNPGISIKFGDIPMPSLPADFALPKELLLIGGVGEYEIVYALPRGCKSSDICIASGDFSGGEIEFKNGGIMRESPPDYRGIAPQERFSKTMQYYAEVFK